MFIETKNSKYMIRRAPSIYTDRHPKEDCVVLRKSFSHGAKESDGNRYSIIARFAAENGDVLRSYEKLPPEITMMHLRQWGFVDTDGAAK